MGQNTTASRPALDDGFASPSEPVFFCACAHCGGSGEVGGFATRDDPYAMMTCPDCQGSGVVEGEPEPIDEEEWWESLQ